jgi:hypothetical protein
VSDVMPGDDSREEDDMPKDDVKRALEAMVNDEAIADQMAAGDFSGVDGLDLSTEEQTLVKDAACDLPEVAGFAVDMFLNFSKLEEKFQKVDQLTQKGQFLNFDTAMRYAYLK